MIARQPCGTCSQLRHRPELGICPAYDAEVQALADQADAERELLADCFRCGGSAIRFASSPKLFEFDRQTAHRCDARRQEPMATAAAVVGQRPLSRTTARLTPASAAPTQSGLRTLD